MQLPSRPGPPKSRIASVLLASGLVDEEGLREAQLQQERWGGALTRHVTELGYASEEAVVAALERGLQVPRRALAAVRPPAAVLSRVDASLAEARIVLPLELRDGGRTLLLAMADPTDVATMDEVARRTHLRVQPAVAGHGELERAIRRHYHGVEDAETPPPADEGDVLDTHSPDAGAHPGLRPGGERGGDAADPVRASAPAPSAADLLEELLTGAAAHPEELTAEERHRLERVQKNQERSGRLMRALVELLFEKGRLTRHELSARLRR